MTHSDFNSIFINLSEINKRLIQNVLELENIHTNIENIFHNSSKCNKCNTIFHINPNYFSQNYLNFCHKLT